MTLEVAFAGVTFQPKERTQMRTIFLSSVAAALLAGDGLAAAPM
jgi:hypothetical protein